MLATGFKSFAEVDLKTMWNLPQGIAFDNYIEAYKNLAPSLKNSFLMVIPATLLSSMLGSLNGFILAKWKFRGADIIFPFILFGMFIPYQSIIIPLVQFMNAAGIKGLAGLALAHIIYGIPITTLTFRNYYASLPQELLEAAKIDGARHAGSLPAHLVAYLHSQFCCGADLAIHICLERLLVCCHSNRQYRVANHCCAQQSWQAVRSSHGMCRWRVRYWRHYPPCWSTFSWDDTSCAAYWPVLLRDKVFDRDSGQ